MPIRIGASSWTLSPSGLWFGTPCLMQPKRERSFGRGEGAPTTLDAFWTRLSATEAERQAWMPYLRVCPVLSGQDIVELER